MSRYYFDLHEGPSFTEDHEGQELADLAQATQVALNAARALMCEDLGHGVLCPSCYIAISNAVHQRVSQVFYRDTYRVKSV